MWKACQFHLLWDLKNCTYPFALKVVPMESLKCFHNFHYWEFKHASIDFELYICNFYVSKKLHFNNCKVDSIMSLRALHLNARFWEVHFSVLTQFLVVYATSNYKKFLYANFSNTIKRDNILKIGYKHFSCYNFKIPMQFHTQNSYTL